MNTVAFYDTKPYDREYFERAPESNQLRHQFHEFRLTSETAASVDISRKGGFRGPKHRHRLDQ